MMIDDALRGYASGHSSAKETKDRTGLDYAEVLDGLSRLIPDGVEQVVVMNGSRLHERRYEGMWEVQKSDPQGMLSKGVFRLDTAASAKANDGATYAGSIRHVSAKGVYQVRSNIGTRQRGLATGLPLSNRSRRSATVSRLSTPGVGGDHGPRPQSQGQGAAAGSLVPYGKANEYQRY